MHGGEGGQIIDERRKATQAGSAIHPSAAAASTAAEVGAPQPWKTEGIEAHDAALLQPFFPRANSELPVPVNLHPVAKISVVSTGDNRRCRVEKLDSLRSL